MSGHRQAALALHGLGTADQQAILAELPAADRQVLNDYLAELRQLGFDGTPLPPAAPASAFASGSGPLERVQRASPAALQQVLGQEPASLIAAVLRQQPWPWTEQLLALLAPAKARLVRGALDEHAAPAPARDRFLLERLAAALAQLAPPAAPAALVRARPAWWNKVTAWTR